MIFCFFCFVFFYFLFLNMRHGQFNIKYCRFHGDVNSFLIDCLSLSLHLTYCSFEIHVVCVCLCVSLFCFSFLFQFNILFERYTLYISIYIIISIITCKLNWRKYFSTCRYMYQYYYLPFLMATCVTFFHGFDKSL